MKVNITKSTTSEWYCSIFGACFIAFALGVLFAGYFSSYSVFIMILGIVMHSWGMYRIHKRNK